MSSEESAYHELCCYTLAHGGGTFIHQHASMLSRRSTPLSGTSRSG